MGAQVFGLGHVAGLAEVESLSWGIITVAHQPTTLHGRRTEVLRVSCPMRGGGPGSPVFDLAGRLIGLVREPAATGGAVVADHVGIVVPIDDVLAAVDDLSPGDTPEPLVASDATGTDPAGAPTPAPVPLTATAASPHLPDHVAVSAYLGRLSEVRATSLAVGLWAGGAAEDSRVQAPRFLPALADDVAAPQLRVGSLSERAGFLRPVRVAMARVDVSNPLTPRDLEHFVGTPAAVPTAEPVDDDDVA